MMLLLRYDSFEEFARVHALPPDLQDRVNLHFK